MRRRGPLADPRLVRALELAAEGDHVDALAAYAALERAGAHVAAPERARVVFACLQGRGPRNRVQPRREPEAPADEAWGLVWSGDLQRARRQAEAGPDSASSWGVLGAVHMLERRSAEAVVWLDKALAHSDEASWRRLRARALFHLRRRDEARQALSSPTDESSLSHQLVKAMLDVDRLQGLPAFRLWYPRFARREAYLNGLFVRALPSVVPSAEIDRAIDRRDVTALLDGVLDRMAGNLGRSATFAEVAADGSRRFVYLDLPLTDRDAAVTQLSPLPCVGAAVVENALRRLIAEHPRSVHARCYLGELLLWLGRYDDAWRLFVEARRIRHARWTAIGMLAVLVLTGRYAAARGMLLYARHGFSHIAGGTLPAYSGSLRRRLGDFDGAVEDLEAAIAAKPTRLGVRLELCLALRSAGRSAAAEEHTTIVAQHGAALLVDAAERLGLDWCADRSRLVTDAVIEEALDAMRGNRSSQLVTWVDASGGLRILEPRAWIESEARGVLSELA